MEMVQNGKTFTVRDDSVRLIYRSCLPFWNRSTYPLQKDRLWGATLDVPELSALSLLISLILDHGLPWWLRQLKKKKNICLQCRRPGFIRFLGCKDSLEKGMASQSSILGWRIPWREEPGGLESMELQRVGHNWATNTFTFHPWQY